MAIQPSNNSTMIAGARAIIELGSCDAWLRPSSRGQLYRVRNRIGRQHTPCLMMWFAVMLWMSLAAPDQAYAAEPAWWAAQKQSCGLSPSLAYNNWNGQCNRSPGGSPASGGGAPQQQMLMQGAGMVGNAIGKALGEAILSRPQQDIAPDQAQQQRKIAAQQLNNSGIYLLKHNDYVGALNEFQQALVQDPGDPVIIKNIALAKQEIKDSEVAAKNRHSLGALLGNASANAGKVESNQTPNSLPPGKNSSGLGLVNLNADPGIVDLRQATKDSLDPTALKSQINGVFTIHAPASAPPDPRLQLPEDKDMELLGLPPQPTPSQWPGPQRPASDPKPVNTIELEQQKAAAGRQFDAIFAQPGGLDDMLDKQTSGGK